MSGFETVASIVGFADVLFKVGNKVIQICQDMKNSHTELDDRFLRIQSAWAKVSSQLILPEPIIEAIGDDHRQLHYQAMLKAEEKISEIYLQLLRVTKPDYVQLQGKLKVLKRTSIRYAFAKEKLDNAICDLESWQQVHDISWLLMIKVATKLFESGSSVTAGINGDILRQKEDDKATSQKSLRIGTSTLNDFTTTVIPFSNAKIGLRKSERIILETIEFTQVTKQDEARLSADVRDLVQKLRSSTRGAGLLKPKGFIKAYAEDLHTLQFTIPFPLPGHLTHPRSLRSALLSDTNLNLSDKIRIGQDLATCVSHIHLFGFVHKSIRPETILLLDNTMSSSLNVSLIGFQDFRKDRGRTALLGDNRWENNLYRHPKRYGVNPEDSYIMQHDIFSLGVCLLEIGLWRSLVDLSNPSQPTLASIEELKLVDKNMKGQFVALAENHLPYIMGSRYTKVVKTCLTCLDVDNEDFGDDSEFLDEDGILVGIRYIEKVVIQLKSIVL